jgi:hypothetical protein
MSTAHPIFVTGVARGGTNLVARMLDAHPAVAVAVDPFFQLFRWLRVALVQTAGLGACREDPIPDYYFSDDLLAALDAVQDGELATPMDAADLPALRADIAARAALDAGDVVPYVHGLAGGTYRELLDSALAAIAEARALEAGWVGCKEVWIVELFAPLARAYPDARFVLVHRDPRATVASMLKLADQEQSQAAHVLSYARHWRKSVGFAAHYLADPHLADRLFVVRYEDVVADPATAAEALAGFLGLEPDESMLGHDGFRDRTTGGVWSANSSYANDAPGILSDSVDRWRDSLDPRARAVVELVCGPELALTGYAADDLVPDDAAALAYLVDTNDSAVSWRSDLRDPRRDVDRELARIELLSHAGNAAPDAVRRAFLFEEAFRALLGSKGKAVVR